LTIGFAPAGLDVTGWGAPVAGGVASPQPVNTAAAAKAAKIQRPNEVLILALSVVAVRDPVDIDLPPFVTHPDCFV